MFGLKDLISLIISAFIILPVVIFMRELGYLLVSWLFGVKKPRITIGSGPRVFKYGMLDVRRYYHLYSWYSYDELEHKNKWIYIAIYSGPILINAVTGLTINAMLANGLLEEFKTFWNRFIFYQFYYVLFDIVPMKTVNGMPNNGMLIYEMLRYGKRTDYNDEPFIPSTSEVEEEYKEQMEEIEEKKEEIRDVGEEDKKREREKEREDEDGKQLGDHREEDDPERPENPSPDDRDPEEGREDEKDRQNRKTGSMED
ncbi:hypothetical protein ACFFIY_13155 [Bhargavaea ullalensis]|uniref:Zincin peptidase n=1 Tax=Bhargavaea ullalensis TaxID=1265685 RepID=A0ABV2G807_9BACL